MTTAKLLIGTFSLAAVVFANACGMDDMMPKPPTDLKAEALSGGAHLTWKDNSSDEAGFMIERMVGTASYSVLTTVPFDTTQHHDAPIVAGMTYKYRVMATSKSGGDHTGDTKYSNEVTFVAPTP